MSFESIECNLITPSEIVKDDKKEYEKRLNIINILFEKVLINDKLKNITSPEELLEYFDIIGDRVVEIDKIAKELNILVSPKNIIQTDIDGYTAIDSETKDVIIYYKNSNNSLRNRFTIAHELGHIFMHFQFGEGLEHMHISSLPSVIDEYKAVNELDYQPMQKNIELILRARSNTVYGDSFEEEAHKFAQDLLVPKTSLKKIFEEDKVIYQSSLANKFFVSKEVIKHAVEDIGCSHQKNYYKL